MEANSTGGQGLRRAVAPSGDDDDDDDDDTVSLKTTLDVFHYCMRTDRQTRRNQDALCFSPSPRMLENYQFMTSYCYFAVTFYAHRTCMLHMCAVEKCMRIKRIWN